MWRGWIPRIRRLEASGSFEVSIAKSIPLALTLLRALLAPVVLLHGYFGGLPEAFAVCLIAAFLSDYFDGVIARRLGVATPGLRRLDSAADSVFYLAASPSPGICTPMRSVNAGRRWQSDVPTLVHALRLRALQKESTDQ